MASDALILRKVGPEETLDIDHLQAAAHDEGWGHVDRTISEWDSGENRFDRDGEALFVAIIDGDAVGVAGLNVDPYMDDPSVGRFRHLYVAPAGRSQGVGRALLDCCLDVAEKSFSRVRLRVVGNEAVDLYLSVGFVPVDEPDATHSLKLDSRRSAPDGGASREL